ncbi:hypothetical protein [Amaricoccus tamworthensis]|uniref:hypothetical protein n=1 Tax=Amaricoccus tamworthensis TaxID=57002 RepID=UPI003C7C4AD2
MKALFGNLVFAVLAQILGRGSLVLASLILAGGLSVSDFAGYANFHLTVNMLATCAALGISVTAARAFATETDNQSRGDIATLWQISALSALAAALLILLVPRWLGGEGPTVPTLYYASAVAIIVMGIVPQGGIAGLAAFRGAFLASLAAAAITIAGAVTARLTGSIETAILTFIAAVSVRVAGETLTILRRTGPPRFTPLHRSLPALHRVLSMIGPMALVSVLAASGAWLAGQIILRTTGEAQFAAYAIGVQWYGLGLFLPSVLSKVIFSRQVAAATGGTASPRILNHGILAALAASLSFACLGLIAEPWLTRLYGPAFAGSPWMIAGFLLAAVPFSVANIIGNEIVARRLQKRWLLFSLIWLAILCATTWVLSPLGYIAAAIGFGLAGTALSGLGFVQIHVQRNNL